MLKIFGSRLSIMLPIFPKHSLNLIWAKADNAVDLDGINNAGLSPARNGFDADVEEFGRLGRGEELPLEVHWSPMNFFILYRVLGCGFEVLPLRIPAIAEWDILRNTAIWWRVKSLSKIKVLNFNINSFISLFPSIITILLIKSSLSSVFFNFFSIFIFL